RRLASAARAGENAKGDHDAALSPRRRRHRAAGDERAVGSTGLSAGRQYARGVCRPNPHRNNQARETYPRCGHPGAVRQFPLYGRSNVMKRPTFLGGASSAVTSGTRKAQTSTTRNAVRALPEPLVWPVVTKLQLGIRSFAGHTDTMLDVVG